MSRSREIRDFLVARRARITPQQAGLPIYGINRMFVGPGEGLTTEDRRR